ncbi:MAG: hypothetical protein AAFY73_00815 [Pseudomonadota bacterium]
MTDHHDDRPSRNAIDSVVNRCAGAFELMINRPQGLRQLDLSAVGTRNSFVALALAIPIELYRMSTDQNIGGHVLEPNLLISDVFLIIGLWMIPLAALHVVSKPLGFADRFPVYVNASNWAKLTIAYLLLPLTIMQTISPNNGLTLLVLFFAFFASLAAAFFLTRTTLEKPSQFAFGIVVLEFLVTVTVFVLFSPTPSV